MVSIITPVYNAAPYLSRCLESILAQTYTDWELLLIDDGSTDGSGSICDTYSSKEPRIRVWHKPNEGVAAARQLGIVEAKGEFSIHVDADDWVEPNMLEEMVGTAVRLNTDVVVADFIMEKGGGIRRFSQKLITSSDRSFVVANLLKGKIHGSLCNKLIRHAIYRKFGLDFVFGVNLCEDSLCCIRLFQCPVNYAYLDKAFYHYVDNGCSTMARGFDQRMYEQIKLYLNTAAAYCPLVCQPVLADRQRINELTAMLHGIRSVRDAYLQGVRFRYKDLFIRNIGWKGRLFVLMYLMRAIQIAEKLFKQ